MRSFESFVRMMAGIVGPEMVQTLWMQNYLEMQSTIPYRTMKSRKWERRRNKAYRRQREEFSKIAMERAKRQVRVLFGIGGD